MIEGGSVRWSPGGLLRRLAGGVPARSPSAASPPIATAGRDPWFTAKRRPDGGGAGSGTKAAAAVLGPSVFHGPRALEMVEAVGAS